MTLDDKIWKELLGGYRIKYDVTLPLKQLETTTDKQKIKEIFNELWDKLLHQGDVDLASYLALPQLVRIGKSKGLFEWNLLALCSVIEQQRHLGANPELPSEYKDYYEAGIKELKEFVMVNINGSHDEETFRTALATLATCNGQIKLGKSILELDDDVMEEFLGKF